MLAREGRCLVIDAHSFPRAPLAYEPDQRAARPGICLGTDAFHTPPALVARAAGLFRDEGFEVGIDRPFAGALVPASRWRRDSRVVALMIGVRRDLYADETSGLPGPGFPRVCEALARLIARIAA